MIRLFSSTDKVFTSNGDVVLNPSKAKVYKADNGDYYLDIEASLDYVDYFVEGNIIVAPTPTGDQAFRIGNVVKKKSKLTSRCYHVFYDSENYLIVDSYVVNKTCNEALVHLNNATDPVSEFSVSSDVTHVDSFRCVRKSLYEAVMTVVQRWGGHLVRDNFSIQIKNSIGQDNGIVVQYKKNLKDITCSENWDNVVTKIYPVGRDGIMLNAVDPSADISITSSTQYDLPYTKTVSFNQTLNEEDYPSEQAFMEALVADLRAQATAYLATNCVPQVNYTLKANLEKLTDVGDPIEVIDERLGVHILTNVIAFEYDCIFEKYTDIQFGNFSQSISNLIQSINSSTETYINGKGYTSTAWNQVVGTGTKIAEVTIDGVTKDVYAPAGGSSYSAGDGININNNTISVDTAFTEASTRTNIASGDLFATILGKIKKFFSDLKAVAFSGSYNDLSDKPTIPTVNNGTLTIQKNGSDVASFTANQSGNSTANISVPTDTNDLTNGAGYITSSALNTKGLTINHGQVSDLYRITASDNITIDIPSKTSDLNNDSGFITTSDLNTKVSKSGDTMTGCLRIQATGAQGNFDEGVRINQGVGGWSTIVLGGSTDSTIGTSDGQFWFGVNRTVSSFLRKLFISHNGSSNSGTYFFADSSDQASPSLRVAGRIVSAGDLWLGDSHAGGYLNGSATNGGCNSILVGDDVWLGDVNVGGILGMKSTGSNCGFRFLNSSGNLIADLISNGSILACSNSIQIDAQGGEIKIRATGSRYTHLKSSASGADRTNYLPNKDGTLATTDDITNGSCNYANSSGSAGSATYAGYVASIGNTAPKSGRDIFYSGLYTYGGYNFPANAPCQYASYVGFGYGANGSAEIAVEWTGGNGMWYRALGDWQSWSSWARVHDQKWAGLNWQTHLFWGDDTIFLTTDSSYWLHLRAGNGIKYRAPYHDFRNADDTAWVSISATQLVPQGSSTRRVKENIKPITEEEAKKILDVNVVSFDYKVGVGFGDGDERKGKFGVIAEEVNEIIPSVVSYELQPDHTYDFNTPSGVWYEKFVPHLIKMVQMQQKEIDELKEIIKTVKESS